MRTLVPHPRSLSLLLAALYASGCGAAPGDAGPSQVDDPVGTTSSAITGSEAVARAQEWVTAEVPYCQSPNGQSDPDPDCVSICSRPTNPAWDPYRSDCSGFVSWAWGLPAPGRTTAELAPADTTVSFAIPGSELQPGDALNIPSDHVILFVSWITKGSSANFMEEPGCSASTPYAHAFTSNLEISGDQVTVDYEGMTFTSIRYTGMTGDADAGVVLPTDGGTLCTVTTTGEEGVCISTTECAALGDKSTAGYCPGAADIECCTVVTKDAGKKDAGEKDAGEKDAGEKDADEKDAGEKPSDAASEPRDAGATPEDATATVEDAAVGAGPDGATSKGSQGKDACAGGGCTAEDSGAEVAPSSGGCSAASGGAAGPSGGIALGLVGVPVLVRRKRRARS